MKPNLELKADKLNQTETVGELDTKRGSHPKPIRKRGFHRALKRGERWALEKKYLNDLMRSMSEQLYQSYMNEVLLFNGFHWAKKTPNDHRP